MKKVCTLNRNKPSVTGETLASYKKENSVHLKKEYAKYKKLPGAELSFDKYVKEKFEYDQHSGGGKIPKLFVGGGHSELDNPYWDNDDKNSTEEEVEVEEAQPSIEERAQSILERLKETGHTLRLVTYQGKRVIETIKANKDKGTYSWYYSAPGHTGSAILQNGHLSELDVFDIYVASLGDGFAGGGDLKKEFLHIYRLTDKDGKFSVKTLKQEYPDILKPNAVMNKMGFSIYSYSKVGYSGWPYTSDRYKKFYEEKSKGKSDTEAFLEADKFSSGGKVYTDKREDSHNAKYWVGKNEDGQWTVFSESDKWKKRDEFEGGLANEKDAIHMAKLSAGVINEADPEEAFMKNEFSGGGVIDSRLSLLKKMDAKNPSATLKARIKLLEKMAKKSANGIEVTLGAEPNPDYDKGSHEGTISIGTHRVKVKDIEEARNKVRTFIDENDLGSGNFNGGELYSDGKKIGYISYNGRVWDLNDKPMDYEKQTQTQAQELAEQIIASAGMPSSKIGTNGDHTIRMTWPESDLEVTIDDEESPVEPGILVRYKTVKREYYLKKIKNAIDDISELKKPRKITYYSLNEHDEGGDPEFVEDLAIVEDNGMLDNKDFIASLEAAVRKARELSHNVRINFDEVWWDDIRNGKEFTTTDEDEDERIWYLTPKVEKPKPKPKPKNWIGTDWENDVYEALEENGEMTRSDAQGVAEAAERLHNTITESYKADLSATETAEAILKATEVPEEPKKPEPKKSDTNWKSIFANPERFQKYGGEFLYPPRAENKVRPTAMMFGKLDNGTYIAEPKMNGSATSVTIFENSVIAKERHNTFFSVPPTFDFGAMHRGKGAMCIVGEFMNKSKKDEEGKAFKGFCIWDLTAYENEILIGSTIEERLELLDKLYPTQSVIKTKEGTDLLYITEVPDIYKVANYDKGFEKLFNELTKIDAIEGFVLKRKNARLEMMTSETNNQGAFIKLRKPTSNYEFAGGGNIDYYDVDEKSVGYCIQNSTDGDLYWSGKGWNNKAYAETYKTKGGAEKTLRIIAEYEQASEEDYKYLNQ